MKNWMTKNWGLCEVYGADREIIDQGLDKMWTTYTNNFKEVCTQVVHGQIRQDFIRFGLHKACYTHIKENRLEYIQNLINGKGIVQLCIKNGR